MKPWLKMAQWITALAGVLCFGANTHLSAQQNSHVRIVRLSFAEGTVSVQRPDVTGWATAPVNTPLQEGFKLSTGKDSFAEVEFENGSTARIGELSMLEFTELSLAPSGGKVNRLALAQGYGTFHITPEPGDIYKVNVARYELTPDSKAEFRADLDADTLRVEVFKGEVDFSGPNGSVRLARNKVLETSLGTEEAYKITHGITKDSWDEWVAERDDVQANNRAPSAYSSQAAGTNYGWADLYNYGSWSYLPGFGYGWIPAMYAGWSPFSVGRWAWYPGFGYTWISFEPWGWLPYHYGNWFFDPTFGWAWFPGSLGAWCPGQVTWYQGPGWVGWAPKTLGGQPGAGGKPVNGSGGCPGAPGCIKSMPVQAFQSGRLVTPTGLMAVDPTKAEQIPKPDVAPTTQVRLTGVPLPAAPAMRASAGPGVQGFRNIQTAAATGQSAVSVPLALSAKPGGGFTRPGPVPGMSARSAASSAGWGYANPGFSAASRSAPHSAASGSFGAARSSSGSFSGGSSHSAGGGFSGSAGGAGSHGSGGGHR